MKERSKDRQEGMRRNIKKVDEQNWKEGMEDKQEGMRRKTKEDEKEKEEEQIGRRRGRTSRRA